MSDNRVLVILIMNDREIQNRIIHTAKQYTPTELQEASNFLNQTYSGKDLEKVRETLLADLQTMKDDVNRIMQTAIEVALGIQLVDNNLITLGDITVSGTQEDGWLWYGWGQVSTHHSSYPLFNSTGAETGTVAKFDTQAEGRKFFTIDSKAMRKVPRGKRLILAYTVLVAAGSPPSNAMRLDGYVRTLLKE